MRLPGKNKDGPVSGVKIEGGNDLQLIEVFVFEKVRFIKEKDGNLFHILNIILYGALDKGKKLCFSIWWFNSQIRANLSVEVHGIYCGQGEVKVFIEIFIKAAYKGS